MELPGKEKAVICRGKHRLIESPSKAPHIMGSSWKVLLIAASILSCWIQSTSAQGNPVRIVPIPPYGTVGSNVLLTILGFTEKGSTYTWYRKTREASNQIASYSLRTRVQTPEDSREKILPDGALLIPNLSLSDASIYILKITIYSVGVGVYEVITQLRVYEKLARPNITTNSIKVRENESLVFTCSTENERANIVWFFNNQPLPLTERTDTSENNQTLTIKSVRREDAGFYQCEAWNPIDAKRSNPFSLMVNYGPDTIKIFQSPESEKIEVRFNNSLTLECQAPSNPPVHYEWHAHDSSELIHSGSTYTIPHASWEHSGKYTCWARNNVTKLSLSKNITIKVIDKYLGGRKGSSLSAGAIIGIVIGELVGIVLIGALIYFLFIRKTGRFSKHHLLEKKHSAPKNGEDTTFYENTACLKGSAILAQGQRSSPTSPEVLSESLYEALDITAEDGYEKIIPSENPQDERKRKSY
ncbi:carcinoembryonic antigen-related cell adhesion molecule 6-like [Monodelphis domestica]|uniref:carcinoembryonic antigen-related cell adhesion molecule 6-like n=1 Tax=Monodelphis domestica TaxID=13616 RepID=UPI0024E1B438|nr:carcinoembryonic antigen-related cell adhesion molecule 6-like [Monodelphis domestica]